MKKLQRYYVDMDCLHDTRQGLLLEHWPWLLAKMDFEKYTTRISDSWILGLGVKLDEWLKAWDARSNSTLAQTPPTVFLYELVNELHEKSAAIALGAPIERPSLTINTYPYKLSKEHYQQYLKFAKEFFGDVCEEVVVLYIKPVDMKEGFLFEHFESVTMYDWRKWLGDNIEWIKKNPNPAFVLNGPALLDLKATVEVSGQIIEDKINPITEVKDFLKEVLTLNLYDTNLFSLRPPELPSSEQDHQK